MISVKASKRNQKIIKEARRMGETVKIAIDKGFQEFGSQLVRTAENQGKNESKYGIFYKTKSGRDYQSSAPGQSPAEAEGNYIELFKYENRGHEMEFGNNADYAEFLEDGTANMEARPGVQNAASAELRGARIFMETALKEEFQKGFDV